MGAPHGSLEERFWPKVVQNEDGCWGWTAYTNKFGYGMIGAGGQYGRQLRAHRVSWELHRGKVPKGLFVCHHCDTPACTRPSHLFLGTHSDNMRDCVRKYRHRAAVRPETNNVGVRNGRHKLTEDQVRAIRSRSETGASGYSLAKEYGVSKTVVRHILTNRLWRHVA